MVSVICPHGLCHLSPWSLSFVPMVSVICPYGLYHLSHSGCAVVPTGLCICSSGLSHRSVKRVLFVPLVSAIDLLCYVSLWFLLFVPLSLSLKTYVEFKLNGWLVKNL